MDILREDIQIGDNLACFRVDVDDPFLANASGQSKSRGRKTFH